MGRVRKAEIEENVLFDEMEVIEFPCDRRWRDNSTGGAVILSGKIKSEA
jgi:hypothetical protein